MASETEIVHVIDDDEALRDSLTFLLRAAKIEVRSYSSATAFLDDCPDINMGCIITDVRMSGMSGIDLLKRLKELRSVFRLSLSPAMATSRWLSRP